MAVWLILSDCNVNKEMYARFFATEHFESAGQLAADSLGLLINRISSFLIMHVHENQEYSVRYD